MGAAKTYDYLFKLLLIGDSGVGKTCLLVRFCDDAYNSTFISTIDFKIRTVELDDRKIKLQIWDILSHSPAGQDGWRSVTTVHYGSAMGIMLVYDVTNEKSFENIKNWVRTIREHATEDVQCMILGNKCDMKDRRQVSREKGEHFALECGSMRFLETSAKSNENVDKAFFDLTRSIKEHQASQQSGTPLTESGRRLNNAPPRRKFFDFSNSCCSIL